MRITPILTVAAALLATDAHAAVAADAVPDAPAPFGVSFDAQGANVRAVAVNGVAAGERVALSCQNCLGQTQVEAVATGPRHVFQPKLRLSDGSRLELTVHARNFARTRVYRLQDGRLALDARWCSSVVDHRRVRCASVNAPRPWATMNVCTPTAVGVRAASPAGGRRSDVVAARFRLQYADGPRWVDVPSGTTPWMRFGRANRSWQGGYTFRFSPIKGRTFRAIVDLEWRRGSTVVRRASRLTSPRRVSGFSSAVCAL